MPEFAILYRHADHADSASKKLQAGDIDQAAAKAIEECPDGEYVAAVWQTDTPTDLIYRHAYQFNPDLLLHHLAGPLSGNVEALSRECHRGDHRKCTSHSHGDHQCECGCHL